MTIADALKRMEDPSRIPCWTIDDAKTVINALGGDASVVDKMDAHCRHGGAKRSDAMALMYCVTLIAEKLTQDQQQ